MKQQIRLWLLENPQFNPYRFSFEKLYRKMTSRLRQLPDFIIIGAGRAGTTALYSYLIQHPLIAAALTDNNESVADLHFFEYMISNNIQWYRSHFPILFSKSNKHKNSFITGEYTSTYMYHPDVPKRIFNLLPKIKLIVILRNPIDKAYSTYQQQFRFGEYTTSFEDTINAEFRRIDLNKDFPELNSNNYDFENFVAQNIIRHGVYADYLETWLKIFDRKQILILNSDDLKKSTKETLRRVFNFLNVSNYDIKDTSQVNVGKYPTINKITRKKLIEFFKPHNQRLNKLLDTEFDWNN
tara:strand:+ start:825 stop:1715 length:891 start_codon:yes stop_codon:yes gene_type:complete